MDELPQACGQKLALSYPCLWAYKLIGPEMGDLRQAVAQIVGERECLLSPSRSSSGGKYHCLDLELVVRDEVDRAACYAALKAHPAVLLVL